MRLIIAVMAISQALVACREVAQVHQSPPEVLAFHTHSGNVYITTAPATGCSYYVTHMNSGFAISPVFRADGLPDCPKVRGSGQ